LNGGTHAALGLAAGVTATYVTDPELPQVFVVMAGIAASLMPDLDEENSMIYHYVMWDILPNKRRALIGCIGAICLFLAILKFSYGLLLASLYFFAIPVVPHRGFTHSIPALAMVTGMAHDIHPDLTAAVFAGYLSHLLADTLTLSGIPWLWPWGKRFNLARIQTGGVSDHLIGLVILLLALAGWASL